jgi:hypothetical protein
VITDANINGSAGINGSKIDAKFPGQIVRAYQYVLEGINSSTTFGKIAVGPDGAFGLSRCYQDGSFIEGLVDFYPNSASGHKNIETQTGYFNQFLTVNGPVTATAFNPPSDSRFKKNVVPLTGSLNKVLKLQGVSFDWDKAAFPKKNFSDGKQIGLIAQETEKIVPEVVSTDKEGYKSLDYDKLSALLIEAVKEQQVTINELKTRVINLEKELNKTTQK